MELKTHVTYIIYICFWIRVLFCINTKCIKECKNIKCALHKTKESKCIGTSQDTGRALPREIPGAKADRYKMQNWNFYSQIQKYKYKHQGPRTNHTKFKTRIYIHKCENTNVYKMARKWNNKHKTVDVEKTQIDRKIGKIGGINIQTGNAKAKRIWTCLDRSGGLTRQGFITGKALTFHWPPVRLARVVLSCCLEYSKGLDKEQSAKDI